MWKYENIYIVRRKSLNIRENDTIGYGVFFSTWFLFVSMSRDAFLNKEPWRVSTNISVVTKHGFAVVRQTWRYLSSARPIENNISNPTPGRALAGNETRLRRSRYGISYNASPPHYNTVKTIQYNDVEIPAEFPRNPAHSFVRNNYTSDDYNVLK